MVNARIHPLVAAAIALGSVAALASACSSAAATATPTSGSPSRNATSASATPSTASPDTEALAAYKAMWADVVTASQTSDYQASYLSDHLGGQALLTVTDNMAADKAHGVIALGQPILHPVVVSASTSSVQIQDCDQETGWLQYFAATHKLVDDTPGGDRSTTATVTDESGTWKVTLINSGADGTCHITP